METRLTVGCRVPATPSLATVVDISADGCMAESSEPFLQRGATILMYFPDRVEVAGTVKWRDGTRFGVRFSTRLSDEQVAKLLDRGIAVDGYDVMTDCFGRQLPPLRQPIEVPIIAPE